MTQATNAADLDEASVTPNLPQASAGLGGPPGLEAVLMKARDASPGQRIEWRDPIAAYGAPAIEAVQPWLADAQLAAFAIRVIERVGCAGEPELASQALRSARPRVPPSAAVDVDWALQHVRAASRPAAVPAPVPVAPHRVAQRPAPRSDRRPRRP